MPSKTPPISIRLSKERAAFVEAYANGRGLKTGAAILAIVDEAMSRGNTPKITAPPQKTPNKKRWDLNLPVGPTRPAPGSLLRGNTPHKSGGSR